MTLRFEHADDIPRRQGSPDNFTGTTYFQPVVTDEARQLLVGRVTFEKGARTHWHTHPGGQFIYTLQGRGWIQERGGERVVVGPGDVVWTEPGVEHWHGATDDNLVTQVILHFEDVQWTGPVTDEEYSSR